MPTDVEAVDIILGGIQGPPGPTGPPGPPIDPSTILVVQEIDTTGDLTVGEDLHVIGTSQLDGAVTSGTTIRAGTQFFELGRSVAVGYWQNEPFNAANYTASHGTWTVQAPDQVVLRYSLIGKTMNVAFVIQNSTVGGSNSTFLRIKVPGGFACSPFGTGRGITDNVDVGKPEAVGLAVITQSSTQILLYQQNYTPWLISNNNTACRGNILFEIA